MGLEVRTVVRPRTSPSDARVAQRPMASRRDGRDDCDCGRGGSGSGARSTTKARFSICLEVGKARQGCSRETDAQAAQEMRFRTDVMVTDKLRSYSAAKAEIGLSTRHEQGLRQNNQAERLSISRRGGARRKMQRFKSACSAQEIPLSLRRRVQRFQRPAPSHVSSIAPRAPRRGDDHVARAVAAA